MDQIKHHEHVELAPFPKVIEKVDDSFQFLMHTSGNKHILLRLWCWVTTILTIFKYGQAGASWIEDVMDGKIFPCSYAVCLRVWESEHSCSVGSKEYWRTLVDSQSRLYAS